MTVQIPSAGPLLTVTRPVVDDVSVRLTAAAVLTVVVLAAVTGQWWLYGVLAVDFALRAAGRRTISPLGALTHHVARPRLRVAPRPTSAAPKRFAAGIGAVLTAAAFAVWLGQVVLTSAPGSGAVVVSPVVWGITVVMIAFPTLEAAFGLCVGCKVYALLIRLGVLPADACVDCAPSVRR